MTDPKAAIAYCKAHIGTGPQYASAGILFGLVCGLGEYIGTAVVAAAAVYFAGIWWERMIRERIGLEDGAD